jgi:GWxTD domain-containing protein
MTLKKNCKCLQIIVLTALVSMACWAQKPTQPSNPDDDPMKREVTPEKKKAQSKRLKQELAQEYRDWLDNDVKWIITDEERAAFKQLSNNEERDQFIEQFWLRRDPTPDTVENEFKEEHYRRIAYADEHYAAGIAGSRTDRGMVYIKFGPPDTTESHPSGGSYQRPYEEGGGTTSTYPFEQWRYRYLPGNNLGNEVIIEFVDTCGCGAYKISIDPNEKDALKWVPGAGQTDAEINGTQTRADRLTGAMSDLPGTGVVSSSKMFDKIAQLSAIQAAPPIKFKELDAVVNSKIRYNLMPFDVRTDVVKVTNATSLVPVTIQIKNRDITFIAKEGIQRGLVNIFGRVSTLTSRIVQTFEDTVNVDVPNDLLERTRDNSSIYWKALPLKPGLYRLDIVVKDINGDHLGTYSRSLNVPKMDEDQGIVTSSLIVADSMEKVPTTNVGSGSFVIGTTKVRPKVPPSDGKQPITFKRNQKANFWMQVYNLGIDQTTMKNNAEVSYEVINLDTQKQVVMSSEKSGNLSPNSDQLTLEKSLPLASVDPGKYQITIKVNDLIAKTSTSKSEKFNVE